MPEECARDQVSKRPSKRQLFGVGLGLLVATVALQLRNSAYSSEYARHYDEPAHFVTGLAVHDYITSGDWSDPLGFAEDFYLHYPKVALGHWPPAFYVIQAIWMLVAGVSRASSMILMALVAVALSLLVYCVLRRELNVWLALCGSFALILHPHVQLSASAVMAELPLAVFAFAAATAFGAFLRRGDRWSALEFSLFAVLAILTKPNGLALALVPPVALMFSGRWERLRSPWFWLPAAIVSAACAPWYWFMLGMMANGPFSTETTLASVSHKAVVYAVNFQTLLGLGLLGLCIIGFTDRVLIAREERGHGVWAALGALMIVAVAYHWFVPADLPQRHILFSLPPAVCFAVAGSNRVASFLPPSPRAAAVVLMLLVGLAGARLTDGVVLPVPPSSGFGEVAVAVQSDASLADSVLMVVSDPIGEGAFVSEVALREDRPGHIVLRGSKVLSRSGWSGGGYELIYRTAQDMWRFVSETPVGVIVIDRSVVEPFLTEDQLLVRAMIDLHRDRFTMMGSFPLQRDGRRVDDTIELYSLNGHQEQDSTPIEIDMRLMLERTLTVEPGP